jgi:predicted nucleic acid-binding protein
MPFWAVLDACVLHPVAIADTLLWVAHVEVYQPLWSQDILAELRRSVLERLPEANIDARIADMVEAFPEAEVVDYDEIVPSLTNDPKDRHVLAAAIVGRAQVIVTTNLRHFSPAACEPYGVEAQHPDEFLTNALHLDHERVIRALAQQAAAKQRPPISFEGLLDRLDELTPGFVGEMREVVERMGERDGHRLDQILDV